MNTRVNANYEIISAVRIDSRHEIVIGHNKKAPGAYVCWYCTDGKSYDTGAYYNNYAGALEKLIFRVRGAGIIK